MTFEAKVRQLGVATWYREHRVGEYPLDQLEML